MYMDHEANYKVIDYSIIKNETTIKPESSIVNVESETYQS